MLLHLHLQLGIVCGCTGLIHKLNLFPNMINKDSLGLSLEVNGPQIGDSTGVVEKPGGNVTARIASNATHQAERANGFGFIRLLLASLVIVSHTPELAYGDRSHELLSRLFGTISFGEFAVDGFFVVSGFFIAGSFTKSAGIGDYLLKRVARIYPGFILASLICILVVAPIAGGQLAQNSALKIAFDILHLRLPDVPGTFAGQHYTALNGSMWTIQFEFRCYLLVAALGALGILTRLSVMASAAAVSFGLNFVVHALPMGGLITGLPFSGSLIGDPNQAFRLAGCFLVGICFYAARYRIRFSGGGAVLAAVLLTVFLFMQSTADAGVALFGGYLIFYVGHISKSTIITRINNPTDLSYGVYLYAWPIGQVLLWLSPNSPLLIIGILTFVIAYGAGWLSWMIIEKPALTAAKGIRRINVGGVVRARFTQEHVASAVGS